MLDRLDRRSRRSVERQRALIRSSQLFDANWYRARYLDATTDSEDPVLHYLLVGAPSDFDPGPRFSTKSYYEANPDVADAELNALAHYLHHGRREGRLLARPTGRASARDPRPGARQRVIAALGTLRRGLDRPIAQYRVSGTRRSEDEALLRRTGGVPPTGWCLARLMDSAPGASFVLQALGSRGSLEVDLRSGQAATLVCLPRFPARLGLRRENGPAGPADVPAWPSRIDVRSIGLVEGLVRFVAGLLARPGALWSAVRHGRVGGLLDAHMKRCVVRPVSGYRNWVRLYDTPTRTQVDVMRARVQTLESPPTISVVVPTYETPATVLRDMLASTRAQIYPHWQVCIADDASQLPHVREILQQFQSEEPRTRLCLRERNGNISAASNSALELADGDFVALLDHDDVLPSHALMLMAEAIQKQPAADLLYSDEDKIDEFGRRYDPYFKPDFSPELLQSQNFVSHLGVYRTEIVKALGGFREGYEGSQDYDLALRVAGRENATIVHVPHILYHWRLYSGADTFSSRHLARATDAARRAIADQSAARGDPVRVVDGIGHYHRVIRPEPAKWPRVSVLVPTRDKVELLRECLDGLMRRTRYADLEVIVVDNGSTERATLDHFRDIERRGVRVLPYTAPFNYSAINNLAARAATGEWLLLLNNDVSVLSPTWLEEMVQRARSPRVGAVGAKLLYPDRTVQHAGVVLGLGGAAGHLYVGAARDDPGYFGQLQMAREASAVTAACMLVSRAAFWQAGGLDEENLPVAFNDVDLCLRLREAGWRIVWTPFAELVHHESKSRGSDFTPERVHKFRAEVDYVRARWGKVLQRDPFFNPNLSLDNPHPTVVFPPRERPWGPRAGTTLQRISRTERLAAD